MKWHELLEWAGWTDIREEFHPSSGYSTVGTTPDGAQSLIPEPTEGNIFELFLGWANDLNNNESRSYEIGQYLITGVRFVKLERRPSGRFSEYGLGEDDTLLDAAHSAMKGMG